MTGTATAAAATAQEIVREAARALRDAGVDGADRDAELLLAAAWTTDRAGLRQRAREVPPDAIVAAFRTMLQRRLVREPLQYILGSWEFWSVEVGVGPAVLIPRPETEMLVERVVDLASGMRAPLRIADIGTGSGCIAIALAAQLTDAELWATDISAAALRVARENAARNGVSERIRFVEGDLCATLAPGTFDVIVSNPPYVPTGELADLEPELAFEPRSALDGGEDGLDVIRRLVPAAAVALRAGGLLLLEMAIDQGDRVLELLDTGEWRDTRVRNDLTGRPRVVEAWRRAREED